MLHASSTSNAGRMASSSLTDTTFFISYHLPFLPLQITNVSYTQALMGSVLGLLPTQMINTYMGSTIRNMQEVLADRADGYIILTIQVIVSIFLSLYLIRKAKQELNKINESSVCNGVEAGEANKSSQLPTITVI